MNIFDWIEWISAACGLIYIILIMRQNIWCWLFGIISSALYIISCFHAKLYLEGGLNFYYILIGVYGWLLWLKKNNNSDETIKVSEWKISWHIINLFICIILTLVLGKIEQKYTESPRPFFDAAITVFSFSASVLEARKILSAWYYWTIINSASVVLMADRGLYKYAVLAFITTVFGIKAFFDWRKSMQQNNALQPL